MENTNIPYIAFESVTLRLERSNKRLWIIIIILILTLLGTNAGWIWYESQFIVTEVSQDVDTGNGDATVIGIGNYNGEDKANNKN